MVRAMTTLKPQLVRADTLDLQDHDTPSAKDHSRQPQHPAPYGYGPAAPHQAQSLRHAEEDAYQQQSTSPRISEERNQAGLYSGNQRFYDDDPEDDIDDEHMNHLHGPNGSQNHDHEYDDAEASDSHDDDLDDDLMDKISSSPSIEDGKYSLPNWPPRSDSVDSGASPAPCSTPTRGNSLSSSPFLSPPAHFPIPCSQEKAPASESHLGEDPFKTNFDPWADHSTAYQYFDQYHSDQPTEAYDDDYELPSYLLPANDPFLVDSPDDTDEGFCDEEDAWVDEDVNIPEYHSSSDDDSEEHVFIDDSRFIDSGWGGECLREIEDIDFEFVYALHTFVATVEGQANATKGDTMVLLDDSNSYWWLVRVVKDGSIGYLPAEHIETPTERLARLNKHRNIDLSASMLGDNPEKSKNPLKKAMRRRNAKTVAFAAPIYYEPSDYEYSDEEDDVDDSQLEPSENGAKADEPEAAQQHQLEDTNVQTQDNRTFSTASTLNGSVQRVVSNEVLNDDEPSSPVKSQALEPSQASIAHQDSVSRSRKGVVRNTDSFFKDDSVETKKISLTPRLLRGDSDSTASNDQQQEIRQRPSEETFDRLLTNDEKPKEQPRKEKKGMLSGLFKRKDKAAKGQAQQERPDKVSDESLRHSPQSKDSLESLNKMDQGPERRPSKLQKQPPTFTSPKSSPTEAKAPQQLQGPAITSAPPAPSGPAPAPPTVRQVEQHEEPVRDQSHSSVQTQNQTPGRFPSLQEKRSIFSPITNAMKSSPASASAADEDPAVKAVYSKRAKERFAIEASDSEDEQTPTAGSLLHPHRSVSPLNDPQQHHRRNDSGMQISPIEPTAEDQGPFSDQHESAFASDSAKKSVDEKAVTPTQPIEITPIESEQTASTSKPSPSTATTHTPSTSRSTPTWSDASLRNYMENDQDIKDLLIIVHDKSNVTPISSDHPLMANLFSSERTKLADMQSQLDSMLMGWMSRKNGTLLSR